MSKEENFDNREFWNERYAQFPELGSGAGSRGYSAWFKRELMGRIVRHNAIGSIVDIGCGDLCWLQDDLLADLDYTGVDISEYIVQQNQQRFPQSRFLVHDIVGTALDVQADLVVSYDVLIHQTTQATFEAALRHILACVGQHGLVSYFTPPDGTAVTRRGLKEIWSGRSKTGPQTELLGPVPASVMREEAEFQAMRQEIRRNDATATRLKVAFYGDLQDWIARLFPQWQVRALTSYELNTVYEISRTGQWLRLEEQAD